FVKTDFCQNRLLSKQTFVTSFLRNVLMLFALCNLSSFEAVSQQNYVFPIFDPNGNSPNYVNTDWKPTGLTPTTSSNFAHSFNTKIRVSKEDDIWEKIGGILISDDATPQAQQARFYAQDYTIRLSPRTSFNDIAYIPKDALLRLYQRIKTDPAIIAYMNGLSIAEKDSIYKFMFPAGQPANNADLNELVRPGLLIAVGDYTTLPEISCGGTNPVRDNAAIYVIDAGSFQPLRLFKFFQCSPDIKTSNFTAIRYLDIVDRFVTVGSCEGFSGVGYQNTNILAFSGDLLYLVWDALPGQDSRTHQYDIKTEYLQSSCEDIATGVDLRYFKKPSPQVGYYNNAGAIMISAYVKNNIGQEKSVLLRLNHDGNPVINTCKIKNAESNNRAHAVSFLTNDVGIWENDPAELGVTGYVTTNQVDNIYIAKFDQMTFFYADGRYPINNAITETPGFSIVSTGDGYAVTGRYEQLPLNTNREHLSYLRVDNNLNSIEHTIFPFLYYGSQSNSYGQRMRFNIGSNSGLMLGGTSTLFGLFNDCSCDGNTSCLCPPPLPPCVNEWKTFTKDPLTLTKTNSNAELCRESISTQSIICNNQTLCWLPMTVCHPDPTKPRYDVCQSPLPNGIRTKLYELLGKDCHKPYCGQSQGPQ
uniref:hypothetical protein n=1 Tax=Flavobacterium filum TaxID=370974 RepID=UPI0023F0ADFE